MRGFSSFRNSRSLFPSAKSKIIALTAVLLLVIGSIYYINNVGKSRNGVAAAAKSEKIAIDKTYTLDARVINTEAELAPVTVTLKNVQKTKSVRANNKTTTLKNDSSFILITFVIENNTNQRLVVTTRDFIRFIDPNNKKFAPSISSQAIVVEPQATKIDSVGYTEPDSMKSMRFAVGALDAEKEIIEINFK